MKFIKFAFVIALACAAGSAAYAADEASAPAMSPEQQAQMEKMKALMAPGEAHRKLESFAGKWKYTSKFWMAPDGKPEESTGTADHQLIYGGRFLKQETKGMWMGEPWEGTGYLGHDNVRDEYQSVWVDSMATSLMWTSGTFDEATQTLNLSGANSCPMTGEKERKARGEWKIVDGDHNSFSMYMSGPDGKEFKGMEINYEHVPA